MSTNGITKRILSLLLVTVFATSLAACGDTWRGAKQDTSENLKATGDAVENAGEKVEP